MISSLRQRKLMYQEILKKEWKLFEASAKQQEMHEEMPDSFFDTVTCVMAPVMYLFVDWVLKSAVEAGHKRLYFLARDGYSMYEVAKILCKKRNLPLECCYLYCSRYALRTAQYHLLLEESLEYICLGGIEITAQKVMRRSGLNPLDCNEILNDMGLSESRHEVLSAGELADLKEKLRKNNTFLKRVYDNSKEKYQDTIAYLKQEGLLQRKDNLEEPLFALVDSGWTGSMQKTLAQLLGSQGNTKKIEGYYFGLYEYPKDVDELTYHTFYFDPGTGLRKKVYFSNSLFECIYSAPHGMTTGYKKQQQDTQVRYLPVFEKIKNPNGKNIENSTKLLVEYAELISDSPLEEGTSLYKEKKDRGRLVSQLFYYFMGHPTVEEAYVFGNYIFCDDVIDEGEQRVAAKLTRKEIQSNFLLPKTINLLKGKPTKESAWLQSSVTLYNQKEARDIWHVTLYKYVLYIRKRIKRGN
ncbi:hypothetical protein LJC58_07050 [Lachnospiraceae bacterium OttesenSCG-928-D06]|nr:hypothetical protein [Lachnospiraceae bacterium OttesenSCG-928-D06]